MLAEGFDYMRRFPGVLVSVQAGYGSNAEKIVRGIVSRVRSDITTRQRRAGMRRRAFSTTVFEALDRKKQPKFGAHVVAVMRDAEARDRLIESLNSSTAYDRLVGAAVDGKVVYASPVTDWSGLSKYLCKEATPQAAYKRDIRRVGGSICLGDRGGDRVILSGDLKNALVNTGRIKPYRRTYATRLAKAPELLAEIEVQYRDSLFAAMPDQARPPSPHVLTGPRRFKLIALSQIPLDLDKQPDAIDLMAGLGPTHEAIAEKIGRSRPQITNILNRQFGASRPVVRRVLQLAKAA
jgi:hypothetical protein